MLSIIGKTYYFRKRFPTWYLTSTGSQQKEYKVSLKTSDKSEASIKAIEELANFNRILSGHKEKKQKYDRIKKYIKTELLELGLIEDIGFPESKITIRYISELKDRFNAVRLNKPQIGNTISQRIDSLTERSLDLFLQALKNESSFDAGRFEQSVFELKNAHGIQVQTKDNIAIRSYIKLSDAYNKWKELSEAKERSIKEWEVYLNRFINVYGDMYIEQIERKHAREYRELLLKVPSRLSDKYKGIPVNQLAELANRGEFGDKKTYTKAAVNKQFQAIASIIGVAIDELDVKTNNAFKAMQFKVKAPKYRKYYTTQELNKLIRSINFVKSAPALRTSPMFWMPLIGIFTGARVEEIGQLDVADIIKHKDFYYFYINEYDEDKGVKTGEIRIVPVHPELIKIGFIDYYKRIKSEGHKKLFPTLKLRNDKYTAKFSKDFGKYMRRYIIMPEDKRKPFHAFRHTFKLACVNSDIPIDYTFKFLGHKPSSVGDKSYDVFYSPQKLNQHMVNVKYEGLKFDSLYPENWTRRLIITRTDPRKAPVVISKPAKSSRKIIIRKAA